MAQHSHFCKICGKGYTACDTCKRDLSKFYWRGVGCSPEHGQLYMLLHEYGSGLVELEDAKEMLSTLDLEGWENYLEHNRVVIAEILGVNEKPLDEPDKATVAPEPVMTLEHKAASDPVVAADLDAEGKVRTAEVQTPPSPHRQYPKKFNGKYRK